MKPQMTTHSQHKASPLTIKAHYLTHIELRSASPDFVQSSEFVLKTRRTVEKLEDESRDWKVELTVQFGPEDESSPVLFHGTITVVGEFEVSPKFPTEKTDDLLKITGASILYGTAREMIANLTARTPYGLISLPSISFVEPRETAPSSRTGLKKALPKKAKTTRKKLPQKSAK